MVLVPLIFVSLLSYARGLIESEIAAGLSLAASQPINEWSFKFSVLKSELDLMSSNVVNMSLVSKIFPEGTVSMQSSSAMPRSLPSAETMSKITEHYESITKIDDDKLGVKKRIASLTESFSCAALPVAYTPILMCSGVVDYSFYLPVNTTAEMLDLEARAQAATAVSFLSPSCLSDIKRLICARVYKPCLSGVVSGDTSTYALADGSYRIPYKRPCQSLCLAASYLGSTCKGLYEALGGDVNCWAAASAFTGMNLYDSSDNATVCNALALVAGKQIVSDPHEAYIGAVCKDIAFDYYVPSPTTVNPLLAPLLPPFVLQSVSEATLSGLEAYVPMYLTTACLRAQRKLMCALTFMPSSPSHLLDAFVGTVYLPSFPARDICTTYQAECSALTALAPALSFNCSGTAGTIQIFPEKEQTIVTLNLGFGPVALRSSPNTLANASCALVTDCPYGFAEPEDPLFPGTSIIPGSGCAQLCPSQIYTADYYKQLFMSSLGAQIYSVLIVAMALVNVYMTNAKRRNIYLVIILLNLFTNSFVALAILLANYQTRDEYKYVCSSRTSVYTLKTANISADSRACAAQAAVGLVVKFFQMWTLFACFSELWVRVVLAAKDVTYYRYFYFYGMMGLVFVNLMVAFLYGEPNIVGAGGGALLCDWSAKDYKVSFLIQGLPSLILFGIEVLMSAHVVYSCVKISMQVQQKGTNAFATIWKSYRTLFLLAGGNIIIFSILLIYFGPVYVYGITPLIIESVTKWIVCLFVKFKSSADPAYIEQCGGYVPPGRGYNGSDQQLALSLTYLSPTIMWLITLSADAKVVWSAMLNKIGASSSRIAVSSRHSSESKTSVQTNNNDGKQHGPLLLSGKTERGSTSNLGLSVRFGSKPNLNKSLTMKGIQVGSKDVSGNVSGDRNVHDDHHPNDDEQKNNDASYTTIVGPGNKYEVTSPVGHSDAPNPIHSRHHGADDDDDGATEYHGDDEVMDIPLISPLEAKKAQEENKPQKKELSC